MFDRKDCTIFGWSLEKTDLQYVLELNEPCFVKLEPLPECELDCEVMDVGFLLSDHLKKHTEGSNLIKGSNPSSEPLDWVAQGVRFL